MSAANASAIRRRAGTNPTISATPTTNNDLQANQPQQKGLTILRGRLLSLSVATRSRYTLYIIL